MLSWYCDVNIFSTMKNVCDKPIVVNCSTFIIKNSNNDSCNILISIYL